MELTEGDSLEGSAYTPMYNPYILPLSSTIIEFMNNNKMFVLQKTCSIVAEINVCEKWRI